MTKEQPPESNKFGGDASLCPHGNFAGSGCEACAREQKEQSQPALKEIESLVEKSSFTRSTTASPECTIERSGKTFTIESIEQADHPDIDKIQAMMVKAFSEEEVEPEEIMRSAIEGKDPWGHECVPLRYYTVKDEQGEVLAFCSGGLLDMKDTAGKSTGESVFLTTFAMTDKDKGVLGATYEAYISAIIGAAQEAQAQGKKLSFVAGPTEASSEKFWNATGWKRIYADTSSGDQKSLRELKYVEPSLDFDPATGEPTSDQAVYEHLMVQAFGDRQITKENVRSITQAYSDWSEWPENAFDSPEAYARSQEYMRSTREQLQSELNRGGELTFLNQRERQRAIRHGSTVDEHVDADRELNY
ncbi:MAG: hypothetical protein WC497_00110 [Patescibacteria group bacterium]